MGLFTMIDSPASAECQASGFIELDWNAEQRVWEIPFERARRWSRA